MSRFIIVLVAVMMLMMACNQNPNNTATKKEHSTDVAKQEQTEAQPNLAYDGEKYIKNIRQLTNGGDNAEAYFSFDDKMLVLQRTNEKEGIACDQIFFGGIPNGDNPFDMKRVSNGKGRTTCSYFMPGNDLVLYASTHHNNDSCPPPLDRSKAGGKYVWGLDADYDIFVADLQGNPVKQLTHEVGYDAEATVSPLGDKIVFTSTRNGDIDLYTMNLDGSDVQQVTHQLGYDGGAFFSPDGKQLVFRSSRPKTDDEINEYKELLAMNMVAPTEMEIYVCNVDGSNLVQVTDLGKANWAPYFHPSGEKIIFCSNHKSSRGFPFNLFLINLDGTGLEQITFDDTFDSFPMFSFSGKQLVFASNRNNGGTRETNVFIADWVE